MWNRIRNTESPWALSESANSRMRHKQNACCLLPNTPYEVAAVIMGYSDRPSISAVFIGTVLGIDMDPKTAIALAELEKSLQELVRLQRRLHRIQRNSLPIYWQLNTHTLYATEHLLPLLQSEKQQLLEAQQASKEI